MLNDRCIKVVILSFSLVLLGGILKPQPTDPHQQIKDERDRYWVLKTHRASKVNMILLGNSRLYRGISPRVMQTNLPRQKIVNFGYSGGGINPVMYREAEKRLDLSENLKSIVLAVSPGTLSSRAARNTFFLQEQARPKEDIYQRLYINPLLHFFSPITIDDMANAIVGKKPDSKRRKYYQEFHDDGWVASWTIPEDHERMLNHYREGLILAEWKVSDDLVRSLLEQTACWTQQGIDVYGFRPPTTNEMETLENKLSGFDEAAFVKQFQEAGGVWFSFSQERYHSYDSSHLHKDSAIQLSRDLSEAIAMHQRISNHK